MSKKEELVVVQSEHFKALPEATQKMIKDLSTDLNTNQLNTFNPLVEAMAILEGYTELKYDAENEESIVSYKEAKKNTGSFNSATKAAKSKLKAPILKLGRQLDAIEKTFLARSKEIAELVSTEFKPYLDDQQRIKDEKIAKKNKATTDKIKDLNEQTVEQSLVIQRNKIFNRYLESNQTVLDSTMEKVDTYSKASLMALKKDLENDLLQIPQDELNILLEDQVVNLQTSFNSMNRSALRMVDARIADLNKPQMPPPTPEPPIVIEEEQCVPGITFTERFSHLMDAVINSIDELETSNDVEAKAKASALAGLGNYTIKIITYIENNG